MFLYNLIFDSWVHPITIVCIQNLQLTVRDNFENWPYNMLNLHLPLQLQNIFTSWIIQNLSSQRHSMYREKIPVAEVTLLDVAWRYVPWEIEIRKSWRKKTQHEVGRLESSRIYKSNSFALKMVLAISFERSAINRRVYRLCTAAAETGKVTVEQILIDFVRMLFRAGCYSGMSGCGQNA